MTGNKSIDDDGEPLAAELALGLLDGSDLLAAQARERADVGFAADVERWRDVASDVVRGSAEMPPSWLWPTLRARAANASNVHASAGRAPSAWRTRLWQTTTAVASAAAIIFGLMTFEQRRPPAAPMLNAPRSAPLVAVLSGPIDSIVVTVSFDPASGQLTLAPYRLRPGAGSAELWVIPPGGAAHSLGVVAWREPSLRAAPDAVRASLRAGAALAISLEPSGGSPSGKPSGPIILKGSLDAI